MFTYQLTFWTVLWDRNYYPCVERRELKLGRLNNLPSILWFVVFVQLLLFETPWTAVRKASLLFTIFKSFLKLMSIESVMPSNHLILCHPLLFLPSVSPSIRVFSRVGSSHQVAKVLDLQLQHQPLHWIFRVNSLVDWFELLVVQGALESVKPRLRLCSACSRRMCLS